MLYIPLVSQQSLVDNAGFQEFFAVSDFLRKKGEKVFWYVVMPSWVIDGLRGHDRIQYVYLDNVRDRSINDVVGFPAFELAQYFSRRGGRFIVDGVLSNCFQFSSYLSRLLSDSEQEKMVPVFIRNSEHLIIKKQGTEQWFSLVGNYLGCYPAVQSEVERSILSKLLSSKTNPSCGKLFIERSFLWPMGFDFELLDRMISDASEQKKKSVLPILFCGGDFDLVKNKRIELKIAHKLFVLGTVVVNVTSWSPRYKVERVLPQKDLSFIQISNFQVSQNIYKKNLLNSHLFVSVSDNYDIEAGNEEISRLLYGQVGIFPYADWVVNRLGEDYPYYYHKGRDDEAIALAEWVAQNYEDAQLKIKPIIEKLQIEQSFGKSISEAWSFMKSKIGEQYQVHDMKVISGKLSLFQTVFNVADKLGQEFSLDVFLDVLEEHLPWLKSWGRKGSLKVLGDVSQILPTLYDIREMLDNLGWIDQCDSSMIKLKRERDPLQGVKL